MFAKAPEELHRGPVRPVKELDGPHDLADLLLYKWVVRASEDDAIDLSDKRRELLLQVGLHFRGIEPARLNEIGKSRAHEGNELRLVLESFFKLQEFLQMERRVRCHDEVAALLRLAVHRGGLDGGLDAEDRNLRVLGPECLRRGACRGVARDHNCLDVSAEQIVCDALRQSEDGFICFITVRSIRGVAVVNEILLRQNTAQFAEDADTAQSGIENTDSLLCIHNNPPKDSRNL